MRKQAYKLKESVAGFDEGDVLDVTARFGDWHLYDVKLESVSDDDGSVELTYGELETVTRARPRAQLQKRDTQKKEASA